MEQTVKSSCKMRALKVFGTRKIKTLFLFKFILRFMLYYGVETYGRKIFDKIYSINKSRTYALRYTMHSENVPNIRVCA